VNPLAAAPGVVEALVAERVGRLPMNEPAFLEFYARTSGPVSRYLRRLTRDAGVADDLLQDAYLRLLTASNIPGDDEHRKNYLFKIATNLARDHFRRERRFVPHDPAHDDRVSTDDPGAAVDRQDDVWLVLGHVTPRDRELLLLAYVEGLSHKEIAEITGLMRASLKPLLFRARRRFASALAARRAEQGLPTELSS
jgi:RNA polymerase sigma-70 factor (ECF subfamily)